MTITLHDLFIDKNRLLGPRVKNSDNTLTGCSIVTAVNTQLTLFYLKPIIPLTTAHHAHGKDGVVGHLRVSIVRKLAEGVQDVQTRVGHGNESQG